MSSARASRRQRAVPDYLRRRATAHADRHGDVRWLRKKGKVPAALALAAKLEDCRPNRRCRSGACRVCSIRAQGYLAQAIQRLAGGKRGGVGVLTIIPQASTTTVGDLAKWDHANHERRLKRALSYAGVEWAVGATNFSLNEHRAQQYQPHWCPHLHAIIRATDFEEVKRKLKQRFETNATIKKPVLLEPWDDHIAAALYVGKTDYTRRIGNTKLKYGRLRANTSDAKLRSAERLELMLHYDQLSILQRMFCFNVQIRQQPHRWRLQSKHHGMPKLAEN